MNFKLALATTLGITCSAAMAEARSDLNLYGSVPVAGDPELTLALNNAKAWCDIELGSSDRPGGAYYSGSSYSVYSGPAAMRNCLARYGFVYQNSEPYAYPVQKVVFIVPPHR